MDSYTFSEMIKEIHHIFDNLPKSRLEPQPLLNLSNRINKKSLHYIKSPLIERVNGTQLKRNKSSLSSDFNLNSTKEFPGLSESTLPRTKLNLPKSNSKSSKRKKLQYIAPVEQISKSLIFKKNQFLNSSLTTNGGVPKEVKEIIKASEIQSNSKTCLCGSEDKSCSYTLPDILPIQNLSRCYLDKIKQFGVASMVKSLHMLIEALVNLNSESLPLSLTDQKKFQDVLCTTADIFHFVIHSLYLLMKTNISKYISLQGLQLLFKSFKPSCVITTELSDYLKSEIDERYNEMKKGDFALEKRLASDGTVKFEIETDSLTSFDTRGAFDGFIKQRDLFYKIYNDYKSGHPNTKSTQLYTLITQIKSFGTYKSFSRLFIKQFLLNDDVKRKSDGDETEGLYSGTKTFEDRFRKRTNNQSTQYHAQFSSLDFFKDFVDKTDSYYFTVHLCDAIRSFIYRIEQEISLECCSEISQENCLISPVIMENFYLLLSKLRKLGHFYGYLIFSCYSKSAHKAGETQPNEREELPHTVASLCNFGLKLLKDSLKKGQLVCSLTWFVQALSCVPPSAPWLHQGVLAESFTFIVQIYRDIYSEGSFQFDIFRLFVISTVNSLFDCCTLRSETFYTYLKKTKAHQVVFQVSDNNIDGLANHFTLSHNLLLLTNWRLSEIESFLQPSNSSLHTIASSTSFSKEVTQDTAVYPKEETLFQDEFVISFFMLQPASLQTSARYLVDRCFSACAHQLIKYLPSKIQVASLIKEKFNPEKVGSLSSEITSKILPQILEQVQQESLIFIKNYAKKTVASLHEDNYDKQVVYTVTNVVQSESQRQIDVWLADRIFSACQTRVKSQINAYKAGKKESSQESLVDAEFLWRFQISLKDVVSDYYDGIKPDLEKTVDLINKACDSYLKIFYDPTLTSIPKSKKGDFMVFGVLLREAICSTETYIGESKSFTDEKLKQHLMKVGVNHFNSQMLVWMIKLIDNL